MLNQFVSSSTQFVNGQFERDINEIFGRSSYSGAIQAIEEIFKAISELICFHLTISPEPRNTICGSKLGVMTVKSRENMLYGSLRVLHIIGIF
jgi:hypothetical protein